MNAESTIRELVAAFLANNHNADGVRFMDRLLLLAGETGKIQCRLANEEALQFQVGDQPPWNLELGRARGKLRILCARLGVLCKDSGETKISLYGDEGTIKKQALFTIFPADEPLVLNGARGLPASERSGSAQTTESWFVRFHNTPSEQDFTITAL
jgi:hypothetical protein